MTLKTHQFVVNSKKLDFEDSDCENNNLPTVCLRQQNTHTGTHTLMYFCPHIVTKVEDGLRLKVNI